jgi:hypothetical protein
VDLVTVRIYHVRFGSRSFNWPRSRIVVCTVHMSLLDGGSSSEKAVGTWGWLARLPTFNWVGCANPEVVCEHIFTHTVSWQLFVTLTVGHRLAYESYRKYRSM